MMILTEPPSLTRYHTVGTDIFSTATATATVNITRNSGTSTRSNENGTHQYHLNPFVSKSCNVASSGVTFQNPPEVTQRNAKFSYLCCTTDMFSVLSSLRRDGEGDEEDFFYSKLGRRESRCLIDEFSPEGRGGSERWHKHNRFETTEQRNSDTSFSSSSSSTTMVASPSSTNSDGMIFWKDLISSMQRCLQKHQINQEEGDKSQDVDRDEIGALWAVGDDWARMEYQKSFVFTENKFKSLHDHNHRTEIVPIKRRIDGTSSYSEVKHIQQQNIEVVVLGAGIC